MSSPRSQATGGAKINVLLRRLTLAGLSLLTVWHLAASFLWVAPASPLRDLLPDGALNSYMLPLFGQAWSLFAPDPLNGDDRLLVRAQLGEGDDATSTEWIDATAAETSLIRHNPFAPRAASMGTLQAFQYRNTFGALSEPEKTIVGYNFYLGDDWLDRLEAELEGSSEEASVTDRYLTEERRVLAYATQVAYAVWGDDVTYVQFRSVRQNVIPFENRNDPDAKLPAEQVINAGWRAPLVMDGQDAGQFRETFLPGLENAKQR